jgi:hypothetical protein
MIRGIVYAFGLLVCSIVFIDCFGQLATGGLHTDEARGVSVQERQALIALFEATGGTHWKNRGGWLGHPGTECTWEGVGCQPSTHEPTTVTGPRLSENNLQGTIPKAAEQLMHLETLELSGNHLSGKAPEA